MFHIWYPKIKAIDRTYKSKIIVVSKLFVETYLKSDGLSQPEQQDIAHLTEKQQTEYLQEVATIREKC